MPNLKLAALSAVAAVSFSASAQAAVFITTEAGAPDVGPAAAETRVITFDSGLESGVTLTGTGGQLVTGNKASRYAAPAGDDTQYLAVGSGSGTSAFLNFTSFLNFQDVSQFSFYWGSIDLYNTVQLVDRLGNVFYSLSGGQLPPATGDQVSGQTNRRVTFNLTGAERELGGLRFISTSPAFELDTISFAVVPEPATWGLMILGFGAVGYALRRKRFSHAVAA